MKNFLLFSLCVICIAFSSCVKPGKGGKATLSVHVFDGECDGSVLAAQNPQATVVAQAVVYINYGGTTVDTDVSSYDDYQTADFGGKTVFDDLKRGDYYLYAKSQDGTLTGGTHFEIKNKIGEREVVICIGEYE